MNDIIIVNEDTSSEIIEWKFLNISRDVTKLKLDGLSRNKVQIEFSILEQNDGGTGQIIYEGDPNAKIYITGIIEGVKNIKSYVPIPFSTYFKRFGLIFGFLIITLVIITIVMWGFERLIKVSKIRFKGVKYILTIFVLLLISLLTVTMMRDVSRSVDKNTSIYVPENIKPLIEF